ncbi:hypothetical protein GQ457_15G006120 [Hibiscus cannabinus]
MGYAESKLADSKARWRSTGIVALRDAKLKRFPDEVLDLDKSVRTLDVTQNKLVEIPMEISKLVNMQRLIVASNHIQRLPSNVGKLQSLKVMILDGNQITSLPDELGELVRLEKLSISGNMLVSLPETIGCLHNLSLLNVSSNKLKHLPESVGICFALEELQANDNLIEELPASICNLVQLKSLSLNNNKVSQIPPNILKDCKALQNFSLHDNPISMSQFQQMDGFEEFEERRKKKFYKQLDSNVMIGSKGLDEGLDFLCVSNPSRLNSLKKSPLRTVKHSSVDPARVAASRSNPFDSDDEIDNKQTLKPSRRTSSEPTLSPPNFGANPFDDEGKVNSSSSSYWQSSASRNKYKNDFRDSGGLENQQVQELENYAVYKAEETTKSVDNCLKIAEEMREGATNTLITLHQQGEQITRTHNVAAGIDHDLSRGEKLLGNLGGMFSRTWKPKKTRPIVGPVITRDDFPKSSGGHLEQREKLGLNVVPKGRSKSRTALPEPTDAYQKVEFEKAKQDDALSDLSDLLGELKVMAVDMGSEIERQTKALDGVQDDVDVLNIRVQGANQRARRLLGK